MKLVGLDYLHRVLTPTIDLIFAEDKDCEIDPSKVWAWLVACYVRRPTRDDCAGA